MIKEKGLKWYGHGKTRDRARTKKNAPVSGKKRREPQVERLVKKKLYGKCGVKGRGRTGQDKVE